MYRLSMCTRLKRRFVQKGVLEPLLLFSKTSADREVQRYSMHAIQVSLNASLENMFGTLCRSFSCPKLPPLVRNETCPKVVTTSLVPELRQKRPVVRKL